MDVVGHQHIGMDFALVFVAGLLELLKIKAIVLIPIENGITINAADNNVLRLAGDDETRKTSHR